MPVHYEVDAAVVAVRIDRAEVANGRPSLAGLGRYASGAWRGRAAVGERES